LFRVLSLPSIGKPPSIVSQSDSNYTSFTKALSEVQTLLDEVSITRGISLTDSISFISSETFAKIISKALNDSTNTLTETLKSDITKAIIENVLIQENISNRISRTLQDTISGFVDDILVAIVTFRAFSDSFSTTDSDSIRPEKIINDTISSLADILTLGVARALTDSFSAIDTTSYGTNKGLADSINSMTSGRIALSSYDGESFFDVFDDYQTYTTIS
jgi:hypothetical protein